MTTTPDTEQPVIETPPLVVTTEQGSKLEQLHAAYADAKAESDAAAKKLKAITDAIKIELTALDPSERRFELTSAADAAVRPLRLSYVPGSWRVDSTRLKAEAPEVYQAFAKRSAPSWRLEIAKGS